MSDSPKAVGYVRVSTAGQAAEGVSLQERNPVKPKKTDTALCENCKERPATHRHHRDEDHKNDDPENIQPLCAICHATVHGIDPKLSELRRLVQLRDFALRGKIAAQNQLRAMRHLEIDTAGWTETAALFEAKIPPQEKAIAKELKRMDDPAAKWMLGIKGIGDVMAAKLIAFIDWGRTPTAASLIRYCGLDPNYTRRRKGMTKDEVGRCGLPFLKKELLGKQLLADQFVMHRTPIYRNVYDKEKAKQLARMKREGHEAKSLKMHAEKRARRKAVDIFLRHLFREAKRLGLIGGSGRADAQRAETAKLRVAARPAKKETRNKKDGRAEICVAKMAIDDLAARPTKTKKRRRRKVMA